MPEDDFISSVLNLNEGYERELFEKYSRRLLALAGSRLPDQIRSRVDADDVLQSVLRSFYRRNQGGEFAFEEDKDLWRLLAAMTYRKVLKTVEFHRRERRDMALDRPVEPVSNEVPEIGLGPDHISMMLDYVDWIRQNLPEDRREVFQMRLQGASIEEIARQQNVSQRTVKRTLAHIRDLASRADDQGD